MKLRALVLMCCYLVSAPVLPQDAPAASDSKPPAVAKESPAATPKPRSDAAEKGKDTTAAEKPPATKPTKDSSGTPQRFIPTEQVRSDFDVSFPVDI